MQEREDFVKWEKWRGKNMKEERNRGTDIEKRAWKKTQNRDAPEKGEKKANRK